MSAKLKSNLTLALKIVVAVALVTFLVRSGQLDPKDLWALMTPGTVALALGLVGLNLVLATWRWIVLVRSRGFDISLKEGFQLYLIGVFFNHALPGAVGGDVVRGYYLVAQHPQRRLDAALSILIDRILGLYSYFILTLMAVAWDFDFVVHHEQIRWVAWACFLIFAGLTLFFLVVFSHRLSKWLGLGFFERRIAIVHKVVSGFQRFGKDRGVIATSVLASVLSQLVILLFFRELARATGDTDVTWPAILFAVPMGFLVTAVPIAPAGIGVGQWAFLYLFQAYVGHATQFGATAITAFQLTLASWGLAGAVFYLRRRRPKELTGGAEGENSHFTHAEVR